ncbi:hypothetical protein AYO20_05148 [Fonsecaea nubica]|uniref:Myb-like DNA-binding domain-containing protein n=1 Tax=Fonsecaea nubica TaxID=856822 RepID=A0A178D0C2_9EURO|nr:hypothetical protein AYO20_05148 [Fonsecaea nubica]OAL35529.1 hypothetical protein AYO20_05148 [Fonsecaea nubica]
MAPATNSVDDFTFIMTCLKHADVKPKINFDEVAKETGAKGESACYHRHWQIMKKWGLAGTSGKGRKAASAASTKATASRKRKPKNEADSDGGPPAKKSKSPLSKKAMQPKVEEIDSEDDECEEEKHVVDAKVEEGLE